MTLEDKLADDCLNPKTKQIKVPGPRQFRGEGEWEDYAEFCKKAQMTELEAAEYWDELQWTGYLPTQEVANGSE